MNVCLSTHLAASLENAAVGEVTMQGAHPEPKWCAGETGLLCRATDCSGNELLVRKWTLLGAVEQFCVGFETRSEQAGEHLSLGGEQLLGLAQLPAMLQACSGHAMPYSSRWGVSSGSLQTLWLCQQVGLAPQRGLCACCVLLAAKHPCVGGWCWERMLPEMCVVGASCCHIAHPKWVYERELGGNSSFFNLSYNLTLKIFLFSEAASTWEMNKQSLQKLLWVFVCVLAQNQEFLCLGQSVILAFFFFLFFLSHLKLFSDKIFSSLCGLAGWKVWLVMNIITCCLVFGSPRSPQPTGGTGLGRWVDLEAMSGDGGTQNEGEGAALRIQQTTLVLHSMSNGKPCSPPPCVSSATAQLCSGGVFVRIYVCQAPTSGEKSVRRS